MCKEKRFLTILVAFLIISALLMITCFAEGQISSENGEEKSGTGENLTLEETLKENETETSGEINIWDRISEYLTGEKLTQSVTFIYNIFCTVLLIVMKKSSKASSAQLLRLVSADNTSAKEKLNSLVDVYNANEKQVAELKLELAEFRKEHKIKTVTAEQFEAVEEGVRGIADILQTIYQNSSTIPAAIKERVTKKINVLNDVIDKAEEDLRKEV